MSDLVSKHGSNVIVEKSNEIIPSGLPMLFKPFTFEFDCIVPKNLSAILGESPQGYFTFYYNNLVLKGFPIDVKGSYKDSEQTVTCLAHPDTPNFMQQLIFAKRKIKRMDNNITINTIGDLDSTLLIFMKSQFWVNSSVSVVIKSEASTDGGQTWEDDILGDTINLTIQSGEFTSSEYDLQNPIGYNKRRLTIISITPTEDDFYMYKLGGVVVI
jgi:hypothetical protein